MEATMQKLVGGCSEDHSVDRKQELLRAIEKCTYPTVEQLAKETNRSKGRVRRTLMVLEREGRVRARVDDLLGVMWKIVPEEERNAKVPCSVCGAEFSPRGLGPHMAAHMRNGHRIESVKSNVIVVPCHEEEDREDDETPEEVVAPTPDVAQFMKTFREFALRTRKAGWHAEVEMRLRYPLASPGVGE